MARGQGRSWRHIRRYNDSRVQPARGMIDVSGLEHKEVIEDSVVDKTHYRLPLVMRKALRVNTADPQ
jgi:hypothetical protein